MKMYEDIYSNIVSGDQLLLRIPVRAVLKFPPNPLPTSNVDIGDQSCLQIPVRAVLELHQLQIVIILTL